MLGMLSVCQTLFSVLYVLAYLIFTAVLKLIAFLYLFFGGRGFESLPRLAQLLGCRASGLNSWPCAGACKDLLAGRFFRRSHARGGSSQGLTLRDQEGAEKGQAIAQESISISAQLN